MVEEADKGEEDAGRAIKAGTTEVTPPAGAQQWDLKETTIA